MYNVMIVDDEPVIKKGLLCFVDWEALDCKVVCDASNGIEAREKLNSNPIDILITDIKMPGMDGLELAKYTYENYPNIKIIILTAFADFSYAQSAIQYNVTGFIVKTNPSEKIPEAVKKAKELILQQKKKEEELKELENRMKDNLAEIREKVLKDILNGITADTGMMESKIKEYGIKLQAYFIVVFDINSISEENNGSAPDECQKPMNAVKNFVSLAFKDHQHYTFIMKKNQLVSIVSFTNNVSSDCTQALLITCNEILEMVLNFMKFTVTIGISGMHKSVNEMPEAYNEAQEATSGSFYGDNNISAYIPEMDFQAANIPLHVHGYTDEIVYHLQQGNGEYAVSSLSKLFEIFRENTVSIEQVKVAGMVLCSLCCRLLTKCRLELPETVVKEPEVYKQIRESKSLQNLSSILTSMIQSISQFIVSNEKQYGYLVREINKYICENFNKDINLQTIADFVHINSSYLSRLYKKETGESVIDALNRYRIDKAKQLLKDPANRVYEVALMVGIEDSAYFTHVFNKYTGMSPKEYKSSFFLP